MDRLDKQLSKYTDEEEIELRRELIAETYRNSLYATAKDLLAYQDINHYTHDPMIRALEAPTRRKLIVTPRGCFKSSIGVVAYSIWSLVRDPNERILIDSELFENSKNFIREIRGRLETDDLIKYFGIFKSKQWAEGSITIAQRTKIYKEASVTAAGVGTAKTGQHYSIIIHDDMNSAKNSQTKEQREKVIAHYRLNTSILEPDGTMVIIGTRYSADDLIGHVLDNEINREGLILG